MKKKIFIPVSFVITIWIIHFIQIFSMSDFGILGIYPRESSSLLGILTSPLIHANFDHLISNSIPILILGITLFVLYEKVALSVWLFNYIFTGIFVWLFARSSYHIGASGIVYGIVSFLFFSGLFRTDIKSTAISGAVAVFYGGLVWGVLPIQAGVSWESHLFGGIVGFVLSYLYRNKYKDEAILAHENDISDRKTFEQFLDEKENRTS